MGIPVIDVFAGPGGLNEGFSSLVSRSDEAVFESAASFEMDPAACETLTLRATYRRVRHSASALEVYYRLVRTEVDLAGALSHPEFALAWKQAETEIHCMELGPETRVDSNRVIAKALARGKSSPDKVWVLVGGPPCQAYSLVGRSRRANDVTFEDDKKHFLYREYLNILAEFRPPIFVMENVKGLLSSKHAGTRIFDRIIHDLRNPAKDLGYSIYSLTASGDESSLAPEDFVIRAEDFGVPQRRHRVILLGIRDDLGAKALPRLSPRATSTVRDAIGALPALRSGLSREPDELERWLSIRRSAQSHFPRRGRGKGRNALTRGAEWMAYDDSGEQSELTTTWLRDAALGGVAQHTTRGHMEADLTRYWFAANTALEVGVSPKLTDFPEWLLPKHASAKASTTTFEDRFRVQVWDKPATTVVSHISKDGHYYIHPDPDQMRSLTLREAARLQTFPDNYLFLGNRTNQFVQVGNAVPPFLAHQIAGLVGRFLGAL